MTENTAGKCDLASMIFLMTDPMVHPGQSPCVLSVELRNGLQQERVSGGTNLPHAVLMRALQQNAKFVFAVRPFHLSRVLSKEFSIALALKVAILSCQFSGH